MVFSSCLALLCLVFYRLFNALSPDQNKKPCFILTKPNFFVATLDSFFLPSVPAKAPDAS
ncbi:MAG: hypothetical protein ACRYHA_29955 [Janthinobacterium lividum]